uniref:Amine oxidase domain-containing protein n=1 Tax=Calcidiscus leptoporus TaxID=127549 RepID=A0A7S0IU80_9EUKA|mmetsp:Transcript_2210/g.4956  ORF Transcript_2210/g.4956 Transcript_2210/m.4956 type:complete len:674 (+) Transcript_2210:41-2062(+)
MAAIAIAACLLLPVAFVLRPQPLLSAGGHALGQLSMIAEVEKPQPALNKNVQQTLSTSREEVMTFSYDMSLETKYEKPTYPGTGNGLSGEEGEYDIVVIGSGMGGLACGAMSAKYGHDVLVLESHIKPGGSAHTFSRIHNGGKYSFEVGPSIFEGLDKPSYNPLRIVMDILGEQMPVKTYTGLGYWTPQGYWRFPIGDDSEAKGGFRATLRQHATDPELAIEQWEAFRARLKDLCGTMSAVSLMNLRQDAGFLATTAGGAPFVMSRPWVLPDLPLVFQSLHETVDQIVTEPFLRNWIDTMCIFCGFPAKGAMTAHILYILDRFFEDEATYCVPIGGTEEIAQTLVRGLEKFGGKLQMNAHVKQILVENGRAVGVELKNGKKIKARKAVVSNATPFDTVKMLGSSPELPPAVEQWRAELGKLPRHGAIMHLFIAIDAEGLDLSHIEDPAHLVVQDWGRSLQDSQNLCSFFIPSLLDPSVCPPGKHVIHVYSSGGEPYEPWEKLEKGSAEYEAYKEQRAEVLWTAVERCIPDVRQRLEFYIIGSPLAHEAFLRRDRGTYGMAWAAGTAAPYAGLVKNLLPFPFPNLKTPVDGLLRCGDSCFPGIGTPSAAASGVIAANTLTHVGKHIDMLREAGAAHPLYSFLDPGLLGSLYLPLVEARTPAAELRGEAQPTVAS